MLPNMERNCSNQLYKRKDTLMFIRPQQLQGCATVRSRKVMDSFGARSSLARIHSFLSTDNMSLTKGDLPFVV